MASNRHLGRIITLQTLYEQGFRADCEDNRLDFKEVLERNISRYSRQVEDKDFIKYLVNGINKNTEYLDDVLRTLATEWPLEHISRMDLIILRIGSFELLFSNGDKRGVPASVVINEAVELAKSFGGDSASKFVNGVLGSLNRGLEAGTIELPKKGSKE